MNRFIARSSFILSLLIVSLPYASATQKAGSAAQEVDYFKKGQEFGKMVREAATQQDESLFGFGDKELIRLQNTLYNEGPSTEAHKTAFKNYQTYFKGVKEALSSYIPLPKTDPLSLMMNYSIKMNQDIADAIIMAPDMATIRTSVGTIMSKAMQDATKLAPKIPQVTFTLNTNHPYYKEGYAVGKISCEWIILEAQGKTTSEDDQIALQKRTVTFISNSSQPGTPQEEAIAASLQYISGMKKALEELDLEATIARYKPSKERAEKMRVTYKLAIDMAQNLFDSMQNPQKGFDSVGESFKEAAAKMNRLEGAADTNRQQKAA